VRSFNPIMPKLLGLMRIRRAGCTRVERPPRSDTYGHQLDAFIGAVRDAQPFPSTAADAVLNMAVIDSIYRAAGLRRSGRAVPRVGRRRTPAPR
jgi:predicted dehydrogenase